MHMSVVSALEKFYSAVTVALFHFFAVVEECTVGLRASVLQVNV